MTSQSSPGDASFHPLVTAEPIAWVLSNTRTRCSGLTSPWAVPAMALPGSSVGPTRVWGCPCPPHCHPLSCARHRCFSPAPGPWPCLPRAIGLFCLCQMSLGMHSQRIHLVVPHAALGALSLQASPLGWCFCQYLFLLHTSHALVLFPHEISTGFHRTGDLQFPSPWLACSDKASLPALSPTAALQLYLVSFLRP